MQKTIACIKNSSSDRDTWNLRVAECAEQISKTAHKCSYAIRDQDIEPAKLLEMRNTEHPNDAIISVWSENTYDHPEIAQLVSELGDFQLYGVMESSAIPFKFELGRAAGMCQVAFIRKPESQTRPSWLAAWLGDHTRVAIETQSNYAYRQNVVATALPYGASNGEWPLMDAIVEENFPARAMIDREYFFDAADDNEKFEHNQQLMMQSCGRFIDFGCFDCVPMSMIVVKA